MWLAGCAARFRRADASRDTIRPGASARTLAAQPEPLPPSWPPPP